MARRRSRSVFSQSRSRSVFSAGGPSRVGGRFMHVLLIIALVLAVVGLVFLGLWDIDPRRETIEKPIPNERFFRGDGAVD